MQLTIAIQSIAYTVPRHETLFTDNSIQCHRKLRNWHLTMACVTQHGHSSAKLCMLHAEFISPFYVLFLCESMWLRLKLIRANTMAIRRFFGENILFFRRDKSGCLNTMCVDGSQNTHALNDGKFLTQFLCVFFCCSFSHYLTPVRCVQIKWNLIMFHLFFLCVSNLRHRKIWTDTDFDESKNRYNLLNKLD